MTGVEDCARCGTPTVALTAPKGDDDKLLCMRCVFEAVGVRSVMGVLDEIAHRHFDAED